MLRCLFPEKRAMTPLGPLLVLGLFVVRQGARDVDDDGHIIVIKILNVATGDCNKELASQRASFHRMISTLKLGAPPLDKIFRECLMVTILFICARSNGGPV
jgi:hypothetical protein